MKRPASFIVPAFLGGIWLAARVPVLPWWFMAGILVILVPALLLFRNRNWMCCFLLLALFLGLFRMQQSDRLSSMWEAALREQGDAPVILEARVTGLRRLSGYDARYQMHIHSLTRNGSMVRARIPVMVYSRDYEGLHLHYSAGTTLRVDTFRIMHDLSMPQEEPYLNHWRHQGFQAVLDVPANGMTVIRSENSFGFVAEKIRIKSEKVIDGLMPEPSNQMMKSLFFGNQGYLDNQLREIFSRTGTAHIVAVSGLHVGILAVLCQSILGKCGIGKRTSRGTTVALVWLYAFMAGLPVSILRAGTMYSLYVASFFLERRYDAKSILLWSGMLFLLINPLSLYTISFQLSFAAAGAILWLYPLMQQQCLSLKIPGKKFLLVTLSAQLGTWPIIAWHFGTFSTVSLMANLLIVPVIGLLMPLGLIMTLAGYISRNIALVFACFAEGGIRYMISVAHFFNQLPFSQITLKIEHYEWVILYYLLLISLVCWLRSLAIHTTTEPVERMIENDEKWRTAGN